MSWDIEIEPEVADWLDGLDGDTQWPRAAQAIDRLESAGNDLRMPHSRSLGEGLFELRFRFDDAEHRITYTFLSGQRIRLLTVFRKQQQVERREVARARKALDRLDT